MEKIKAAFSTMLPWDEASKTAACQAALSLVARQQTASVAVATGDTTRQEDPAKGPPGEQTSSVAVATGDTTSERIQPRVLVRKVRQGSGERPNLVRVCEVE
jgi:hypothetical protein